MDLRVIPNLFHENRIHRRERDPEDPRGYLGLASLHLTRGAPDEGLEFLDRYLSLVGPSGRVSADFLELRQDLIARSQIPHLPPENPFSERIRALHRIARAASPKVVPHLLPLLDDPNYRIRWGTAHALGEICRVDDSTASRLGLDRAAWTKWIEENPRSEE